LGDTFAMVYSRYSLLIFVPFLTYSHNLPLAVWLNQGLLGLLAFGGIVVAFYVFVARVRRIVREPLFDGAWLGVAAMLLHGPTDAPQYMAGSYWTMPVLFFTLGLAVAAGRSALRGDTKARVQQPRRWLRPLAALAAFAVLLALVAFQRPLRAAWHTNLGAITEARAALAPGLEQTERDALYTSAQDAYRTALAIDPTWPNANRRLGNLLVELGQFKAAEPLLERAYEREPDYQATVKGLGLARVWVGKTDQAARLFLELNNPTAMAKELYTWGRYRAESGQPLLTAYAYETAEAMYPNAPNPDVWQEIADHYRAAAQLDTARAWYERVLARRPDDPRARQALAELR
jgi:tetratricopeptide (TPR) repeat protein